MTEITSGNAIAGQSGLPATADASRMVVQALLLIDNDRHGALACLDRARQMIADGNERSASINAPETPGAIPARGGLAPWQVSRIRRYIDQHIDEPITLVKLAGTLGLSESYFSAAFKVSFGVSPHAFIIGQRVERAKKSIALTDTPLAEIALDCGLADQAHLSRIFRRHTGFTPSSWRRACLGSAAIALA
ncbi:helix-turn-helix domain-containing protein [Martelella sp. FOR1707]